MSRRARILVIVAGLVVLAAVVAALGYAFTRDDGPHKPRYPGRIAVREGCGLRHMFFDASDQKVMCLQDVFDTVSVSRNGDKLAWDTKGGNAIIVSGVDGTSPVNAPVPLGSNSAPEPLARRNEDRVPALAEERRQVRHLGHVDHGLGRGAGDEHAQRLRRRLVARPATGSRTSRTGRSRRSRARSRSSVRTATTRTRSSRATRRTGRPTGSSSSTSTTARSGRSTPTAPTRTRLIPNGHAPAWSRDGQLIAFMRAEKCSRNICPERSYLAFANGTDPHPVGPAYPSERQVVWLPDPFE